MTDELEPSIADRDIKPANVSTTTRDGVTLHVRRSEDPERCARLMEILQAMVAERRAGAADPEKKP